jgi:hypothetical protein
MEIKPLSSSGIARGGIAWGLYTSMLTGFSADMGWFGEGRVFQVRDGNNIMPTLVFNVGGILFYTTSSSDYDIFMTVYLRWLEFRFLLRSELLPVA